MAESIKIGRILRGVVVSDKMQNSIVVRVNRLKKHSKYLKYQKTHTKLIAHDQNNEAKIGDIVTIRESRPLSRRKRWVLREIVTRTADTQIQSDDQE
ncbi:MAG: 30S ribosomal protein S17 [Candidatus Sungbacteria bacterium RIFCSPLOWO2_02_FULL_48_13b]|uniref:Small ribosomal subunit protein uS17 n=2 Tax=Candidatus Sungiibacteriota TaxID=1817917 RepID=A0A1G2LG83_9BACT|nr:MAG: 30S ribosomal protein S17 [Candidatus Sungbacteria bacterium RIFCSPHIGHO2_02_FULL_49_20]OHA09842.1 MAG: 30S ribosomal protein S17 [Candidatus Sungbacteria bacterium RIFCSPLOWO2_02_FULL_48_13b]